MDAFDLEFKEVVGKGSFGTVYRAVLRRPKGFRKDVAVKVLHDRWVADRVITARLRDEARVLGLLRHRALPTAEGLFWVADRPALVTEFVDGVTLTQLRARRPVPVTVALEMCAEVANALHAAWNTPGPDGRPLHLVHRDVKPSNLQITRAGEVKLLDFGVARADFADREADTQNHLVGSLSYMSPERLDFVHGPEGDVYSVGVVLAEVLLGRRLERTSADRSRHEAFLAALGAQLETVQGESSASGVIELIRDLLAYDADARPVPRDVERRCRELRRGLSGPDLADWAEPAVEEARAHRAVVPEPSSISLVGSSLPARHQQDTGPPAPDREAEPDAPPAEALAELPTVPRLQPGGDELPTVPRLRPGLEDLPTVPRMQLGSEDLADFPSGPGPSDRLAPPTEVESGEPPLRSWLIAAGIAFGMLFAAVAALGVVIGGSGVLAARSTTPPITTATTPTPALPTPVLPTPAPTSAAPVPGPTTPAPEPGPLPMETTAAPAPARPVAPKPAAPTSPRSAGVVSASAFASFVSTHPEWSRDEAIARKRAGPSYLQGWSGASPPAAATHATQVSFFAAQAYCAPRGGLPSIDAAPATWPEGSGPFQEWRVTADGGAAWRRFDGVVSTAVRRTDANGFTGFRCAK